MRLYRLRLFNTILSAVGTKVRMVELGVCARALRDPHMAAERYEKERAMVELVHVFPAAAVFSCERFFIGTVEYDHDIEGILPGDEPAHVWRGWGQLRARQTHVADTGMWQKSKT